MSTSRKESIDVQNRMISLSASRNVTISLKVHIRIIEKLNRYVLVFESMFLFFYLKYPSLDRAESDQNEKLLSIYGLA